jgi:hypothetical protein
MGEQLAAPLDGDGRVARCGVAMTSSWDSWRSSAAQCQHIRAIAVERPAEPIGDVGPQLLTQVREIVADLLDLRRTARNATRLDSRRRTSCRTTALVDASSRSPGPGSPRR